MEIFAVIFCLSLVSFSGFSATYFERVDEIAKKTQAPEIHLESMGPLVVLGNSSLENAKIVFLPEVHDDPDSLLTQLLLIAKEKKSDQPFIVLDESLSSMKKSIWDVFSQKSLEIIAAENQRKTRQKYVPQQFELALHKLATKFKSSYGQLNFLKGSNIWSLRNFIDQATPFYGWDSSSLHSLTDRNIQMVKSLKAALKNNGRVMVMAGARHVPELEYLTSRKLLCSGEQFQDMNEFFLAIDRKFGGRPLLKHGIGATLPIHNFLSKERYAVVFSQKLLKELNQVISNMENRRFKNCVKI